MVLANGDINIIADMEGTTGVKLHNNRQKLRARFDIVRKLGQGTYGKVQLAINKDTGEEVAIKTIKKSKIETEQDLVRIQREIQIMSSVQHAHIIHIYEVFENREKIVLVMEYANGGELYDYLSFKKVLTEAEARRVFRQVVAAVYYCHKNMICHRDLKLENILLDERGNAKIADFGLSNIFDERSFLHTFCGSPLYASPEIVKGTPYFGPEVDCWSLGVLLYTLVYGAMPFDGSNFKRLVKQISEGDYYEPKVPSEASGLIRHMLTVEPSKRATVDDICCHVWVNVDEELPLLDVSQEMCRQMPVRLDYLLALSAAAAGAAADALPSPPPPPPDGVENTADSVATGDALSAAGEAAPEEEDEASQWERPALQAQTSENEQNGAATAKKHKMAPSTSAVLPNSSSHKVVHKKRKEDEKKPDVSGSDSNDKGGGAEKTVNAESRTQEATASSDAEMTSVEDGKKSDSNAETTSAQTESVDDNKGKEETENKKEEETIPGGSTELTTETNKDEVKSATNTTDKTATTLKKKPSINRKAATAADATVAAKLDNGAAENGTTKPVNKVSKFRKSVSVGKDANGSTSPSTPPIEGGAVIAAAAQTPPTPPPAAGTEKRKASLSSWSRIADARKAFERRSPEKKPAFLPGSKVNSVRRSFESPPSTPESASPSIKGVPRPFGSNVERKGSMTNSASAAAVAKKNDEKKNGTATADSIPSPNQENDQDKNIGAPLTKQPSKTNARTSSPTKGIRATDKSADSGPHHRGCVPSEARAAAAAAQEAKKVSPPKSLVRKNSLSKTATGGGFSKSPSKEMKASATPTVGRTTSTVRPRSPTKAMKGAAPNLTGKVTPSTLATKVPPDSKPTEPSAEENASATTETNEATEAVDKTEPDQSTGELEVPSREKRGSIEIAPLPSSALVRRYPEADQDDKEVGGPQLRFVPRNKGSFTLLGVKSEVVFDVDNDGTQLAIEDVNSNKEMQANPPKIIKAKSESGNIQVAARPADTREAATASESDSKIIRYIATVRKHGSSGECGATGVESGPERVTLLKLRCSSSHDGFSDEARANDSPGTPDTTNTEQIKAVGTKSPSIKISMKLGEHQTQVEVNSGVEQRGYNVYRSKYHSVQKYRSIIERRDGEESAEHHEEVREVQQSAEAAGTAAPPTKEKPAAVERSDSFSSTGSNDDLEDVFESLTSESLFTSLLSRTRNLMHRLSDGGSSESSSHGRFLRSEMMRRPTAMSSILSSVGGRSGFQLPSPMGSFAINSPTLSFRMNMAPRSTYATEHPTTYRNNGSTSSLRSAGGDFRSADDGGAASDTAESRSARRFRYSRSTTRSGGEEDEDDAIAARIRSTNASVTSSRVSFSNYAGSRSTSVNSQLSSSESREQQRQSRYDAAHRNVVDASVQQRDGARSDIISALMRHRNRSLDNRDRPQSYYEGNSTPSSRDWTPTSSFSSMRSPSSAYAQQQQQQQQQSSVQSSSRPRGLQDTSREEPAGLYGSRRAGGRYQRYSKSVTKELAEEYDSEESSNLLRPRSLLVLSDLSADEAGSSAAVSPSEESTAAASTVSRDYSKSVSQEGSTRREEELESEHQHRVTQLTNGTVTSTVRRETKRSVSQTEDGSDGTASAGSATPTGLPQRMLKKMSGDDLPRMDSGIGSLHDGGVSSGPATPTSAGVSSRRGILKFARSVSSELESLEEEINRIGGAGENRAGRSSEAAGRNEPPPDGATPDLSKRRTSGEGADNGQGDNGSATPVSDSAETGSVCSDTASTDTGPYSQSRGSEEESVGERIRRKSFFARFNDTRTPRKSRKTSSTNLPSVAALRSELGRSSSLRHHIFDSDSPLGAGSSHRSYFDPTADFFSPPPLMRRCSGGNGNGGGGGSAPHHQRWSMHFGSNAADGSSFDPNDYLYGGSGDSCVPPLPRRGSQTGQSSSYAANSARNNAQDGSWNGEDYEQSAGLNRTHSLPEEDCPPRPVFRQHSVPSGTNGSSNPAPGDTDGAEGNPAPTTATTTRRRPDRLNLYQTTSRGGGQSAISPSEDGSDMSDSGPPGLPTGLSRRNVTMAGSPPGGGRRSASRPGRLDPLDAWDGVGSLHGRAGHSLASLMDSLESPSEVLQKAMDLCDSLRFS